MAYRVKAVTAVIKIGGSERYLHRGAIVPDAATNAEHLLAVGLLEEIEQDAGDAEAPEADSPEDDKAAAEKAEADKAAAEKAEPEKPAGRSSTAKK